MNIPNKLTMLRVLLIPFFVVFMLVPPVKPIFGAADPWVALALFIIASLTDLLDGKIARKYNLVTNFGKLMDPLADKLLVSSALICLTYQGKLEAWIAIVIIAREFIISGVRQLAIEAGVVIAASYWGKFKTVFQMIMVGMMIVSLEVLMPLQVIVKWVAVALTIISLIDYLIKNRSLILGKNGNDI